jgi:CRISPR system Cascade subunit CasC
MPTGDMVQVHMLTAYPAALLNRDDAGLAKRIPFGQRADGEAAIRTRVSSQCLKKHWRETPLVKAFGDLADRSTRIYEQRIAEPLIQQHNAKPEEAAAIAQYLLENTLSNKEDKKAASEAESDAEKRKATKAKDGAAAVRTGQVVVLTRAETNFLAETGAEILRRLREAGATASDRKAVEKALPFERDELKRLKQQLGVLAASPDTALFGRMVTSDLFARVDAAVSVAHAFTTHEEHSETDYFTAVDTLNRDDAGAGLIQDTELTSGVFYTYAVLDMNQLRENLNDEQKASAERMARALVEAMATVTPGAKRGSTAPYAYAEMVLLERGPVQPRTLANAFLQPVRANGTGLMAESVQQLLSYRHRLTEMYGEDGAATLATIHEAESNGLRRAPLRQALAEIFPGS